MKNDLYERFVKEAAEFHFQHLGGGGGGRGTIFQSNYPTFVMVRFFHPSVNFFWESERNRIFEHLKLTFSYFRDIFERQIVLTLLAYQKTLLHKSMFLQLARQHCCCEAGCRKYMRV